MRIFVSLSLLVLMVTACVRIAGQRFSWYHDQANDTLRILIHYDGIHEGTGRQAKGAEQIPKFVKDGDILVLDWWGHLEMGPIREKLKNGNLLEKMVAKMLTSFQARAAGHYVDPTGRIGALQVITVPKVSRFVKKLNELVCAAAIAGKLADKGMPKTSELQKEEARNRHEWIRLDGHAIHVRIPIHPDEASKAKSDFLLGLVSRAFAKEGPEHKALVRRVVKQIAAAPVSVILEEELLTLVFGYKTRTCTIRLTCRDDYNPKLEDVVKESVTTDLDREFAAALVAQLEATDQGEPPRLPGLFGDLEEWGPPEEQVRALLAVAKAPENGKRLPKMSADATRDKAFAALAVFGKSWNKRGLVPKAPASMEATDDDWFAWAQWYTVVTGRKPLDSDE